MKIRLLFLAMAAALIAASVGLTSCSKEDSGTEDVQPKNLEGTWVCANKETKEIEVAMTFDKGNNVVAFMEGIWLFCNVERTPTTMTLKGSQISMVNFKDYGNFTAKTIPFNVTIKFDYQQNGNTLVISNINATPALTVQFRQKYELTFDKIYQGESIIL